MANLVTNHVEINANPQVINSILRRCFNEQNEFDFNKFAPTPPGLDLVTAPAQCRAIALALKHMSNKEKREVLSHFTDNLIDILVDVSDAAEEKLNKEFDAFIKAHGNDFEFVKEGIDTYEKLGKQYIKNYIETGSFDWIEWRNKHWGTRFSPERTSLCEQESPTKLEFYFDTVQTMPSKIYELLTKTFNIDSFKVEYADEDLGVNCGELYYDKREGFSKWKPDNFEDAFSFAAFVHGYNPVELNERYESLNSFGEMNY